MSLESGEIVRAINHGTQPVTLTYGGRDYVVHPNKESAVPFDAMVLWFGDPRSMNIIRSYKDSHDIYTWVPDRETEVRRLRIKWGITTGPTNTIPLHIPIRFSEFDGTPIITVVDDPDGDNINVMPQTVTEVELLRNQIVALTSRLDQQEAAMRPSPVDDEIAASVGEHDIATQISQAAHPSQPVTASATDADIPYDDSTTQHTGAESATASPVDTTGNKINLSYSPETLAAYKRAAEQRNQ
jgi:hypothetical protein